MFPIPTEPSSMTQKELLDDGMTDKEGMQWSDTSVPPNDEGNYGRWSEEDNMKGSESDSSYTTIN